MISLDSPVTEVSGIGPARAGALKKLGISSIGDLLYHFPRTYQNRGLTIPLAESSEGYAASFILRVSTNPKNATLRRRMTITKFKACDEFGTEAEIIYFNQPYLQRTFSVGAEFRFYGKVEKKGRKYTLSSPEYEAITDSGKMRDFVPIYPLTAQINEKAMRRMICDALAETMPYINDPMPEQIKKKYSLPSLQYALANVHLPSDESSLKRALRRLCFDEFFYFSVGINLSRRKNRDRLAPSIKNIDITDFLSRLPYELTGAQKRSIGEILSDMHGDGSPLVPKMNRILTGDVGCGKTVCAAAAVYATVKSGFQAALMAPTEILAIQHYRDFEKMFSGMGIRVLLLTGSLSPAQKRKAQAIISSGEADAVIGTHALISGKVSFSNLALTITDEQHRFGVAERARLDGKSESSHTLVMSATPIPRTLALTIYGDLSISKIDEMPAGRQRTDTFALDGSYRERVYSFIRKQIDDGGQVYVVCPAIEENENECEDDTSAHDNENSYESGIVDTFTIDELFHSNNQKDTTTTTLKTVSRYSEELKSIFPDYRIAVMHGKMKQSEKDNIMKSFIDGYTDILVSTTVIEVGVNVPNACLMLVENAERFGLSQLHQLRGRVGRGSRKSYCILLSDSKSPSALDRLRTMAKTYDGYRIAEEDLRQRGPGDFFLSAQGTTLRQSGGFSFKLGMVSDMTVASEAFRAARDTVEDGIPDSVLRETERLFRIEENTVS
ncbi:MAG: ATP-dependent DNA helicase RecG [Eubacteriales bacterium]|nr:ATP-dependent DNA helicase RecG [Eubacteriales bacterium]